MFIWSFEFFFQGEAEDSFFFSSFYNPENGIGTCSSSGYYRELRL